MVKMQCCKWLKSPLARQMYASLSCYLSVMTTTMCYYWISPFYSLFTKDAPQIMTVNQFALLTATTSIAETACCIPIASLADRFGRKSTLMLVGPISALLWIIAIFTKDIVFLFISRIVQGFLLGIIEVVASVYIAEISCPQWRGTLGGYYSVFNNIGLIYIYLNGGYFSYNNYLISLIAIPVLFTITFVIMPESPYYYFMRNDRDKAIEALAWFRNDYNIQNEAIEIENAVREDMKNKANWKDLIATKSDRRALLIVLIVTISRYMIGVGTFMAYGNSIFGKASQQFLTPNQLSIVSCFLFAITAFLASFFSDIVGRRILLLTSLYGSLFSNIVLAIYFFILEKTILTTETYNWILYIGTIGFCVFTNIGLTQLMPTIKAEYFPSHTRSIGSAFATIVSGIVVFLQMYTFPLIDECCGMYLNFISFAFFSLLGLIFVMIYLTESAGKTLAEINVDIKNVTANK